MPWKCTSIMPDSRVGKMSTNLFLNLKAYPRFQRLALTPKDEEDPGWYILSESSLQPLSGYRWDINR